MPEPRPDAKRGVRRAFGRAAAGYDSHAVVQKEVGERLLHHLDPIRIEPRRVLDLGCGTGLFFGELGRRFPRAELIGLDIAQQMLVQANARAPWWRRVLPRPQPRLVCADVERLPLAAGCAQLAFSNLVLQWCEPARAFAEAARVLETDGLYLFSSYGPDTLKELRAAFAAVDDAPHVNRFVDMHDLGDALVAAGFADPVMEMEILTVEYASVEALARDLKGAGGQHVLESRASGLPSPRRWQRMVQRYEDHRRDGILPATFEVIYGHAWRTAPRRIADGRQIIGFQRRPAR